MESKNNRQWDEHGAIAAVVRGDTAGYVWLMNQYGPMVFAFITRLVNRIQDAEELAQDTFVKAFTHLHCFDASKASFSTWLLRIAYHETLNHFRRRKCETVYLSDCFVSEVEDAMSDEVMMHMDELDWEYPLSTDERRIRCLEYCIDLLSVEERALLILYYFENHSVQEIAKIFAVSPQALTSRLYRVRRKLYKMVETNIRKL